MRKKIKSAKKQSAKTNKVRIERFGSDGSEIRLVYIKVQANAATSKGRADKENS